MIWRVLLEGLGLGGLLILVCAVGIRNRALGMAVISALLAGIMSLIMK